MKSILKLERINRTACRALIFLALLLVAQPTTLFAQQPEGQDWQRASGNASEFHNNFPDQPNSQAVRTAFQVQPAHLNHDSTIQHADHQQLLPQPVRDFNTLEGQQPVWKGDEVVDFESESGPLKWTETIQNKFSSLDVKKVVSSLAIVIGGYLGFVWLTRKFGGASDKSLPSEVFEVIGTSPLNPKQNLQLVRLGSKLLVLVSGDEGVSPIAEVTDADEVEYLTGVCLQKSGRSNSGGGNNVTVFRRALDRARNEGGSNEAAMDKVISKLSELAGKTNRTNFEA